MNRTGLTIFTRLVQVGNALEHWRERFPVCSDDWSAATDILGALDAAIDILVEAGLATDNEKEVRE